MTGRPGGKTALMALRILAQNDAKRKQIMLLQGNKYLITDARGALFDPQRVQL